MRKKLLTLFFISAIVFIGCREDVSTAKTIETIQVENEEEYINNWNQSAEIIAMDFAKKMKNKSFRKLIKHEVMLQFDGDYNILLSSFAQRIPIYLEYEANKGLNSRTNNNENNISNLNFTVIKEMATKYPQMQIAVQPYASDWDPNKEMLDVVHVGIDHDDQKDTSVEGFTSENQQKIEVSVTEDPNENYLVVSSNERTIVDDAGNTRLTFGCGDTIAEMFVQAPYQPDNHIIEPLEPCYGGGGSGSGGDSTPTSDYPINLDTYKDFKGSGIGGAIPSLIQTHPATVNYANTRNYVEIDNNSSKISPPDSNGKLKKIGEAAGRPYYRKNYKYERIRQIRCDNPRELEPWTAGRLEIRLRKFSTLADDVYKIGESIPINFHKIDRHHMKGKWYTVRKNQTHLWRFDKTGTSIGYYWFEHDKSVKPKDIKDIGAIANEILKKNDQDTTWTTLLTSVAMLNAQLENKKDDVIGYVTLSTFNNDSEFNFPRGSFSVKSWTDEN